MAVTFTAERAEFVDATDSATYNLCTTTGAFTPTFGSLLFCLVLGAKTADAVFDLSGVADTGMGLTWTQRNIQTTTNTQFYRMHLLTTTVDKTPASITAVTATWNQTILSTDGWIGEFAGHNHSNPVKNVGSAANASGTNPGASMPVAPDSDSMSLVAAITRRNPPNWTNASWTKDMDTGVSTPVTGLTIWHLAATQTMSGTTGTAAQNFTAIYEIDAAVGPPPMFAPRTQQRATDLW